MESSSTQASLLYCLRRQVLLSLLLLFIKVKPCYQSMTSFHNQSKTDTKTTVCESPQTLSDQSVSSYQAGSTFLGLAPSFSFLNTVRSNKEFKFC